MKKLIYLLLTALFLFSALPAKSIEIADILSRIGFNISSQKNEQSEITKVIEKQQNYTNKKNYTKLKLLFADNYASFDGITLDNYIESIKKNHELHSKLIYKTEITDIKINGDYATVYAIDTSEGITKEPYKDIEGKGILTSYAKSIYYLKKENGDWKINADWVYSEKTSLKYGIAKDIEITLSAPECIKANSEYNIKISAVLPEHTGIIASITTEPIEYPQTIKSEDIFRPMKQDGELERVVISNNNGQNEIALASIAVAKASMNEDTQVDIKMEGVAFIASRVNVLPQKVTQNEQKE